MNNHKRYRYPQSIISYAVYLGRHLETANQYRISREAVFVEWKLVVEYELPKQVLYSPQVALRGSTWA